MAVERPDPAEEYYTEERCHILETWNTERDPAASIARARVHPGVTTRLHRVKDTIERYIIIEGAGQVEVGGRGPEAVGPGDVVIIPAGAAQRIRNTGAGDLVFYCICTPRFVQENYEALE